MDDPPRSPGAPSAGGLRRVVEDQFAQVYDELRRVAAGALRAERAGHTLQPTALVHEAYVRLAASDALQWQDRAHFVAIAATAMRRILVDHARGHNAAKRGGGDQRLPIEQVDVPAPEADVDVVALDESLVRLAALDPRQARIVELRYFGGLSVEETATIVGTSPRTVKRDWQMARAWLQREMARQGG
jgi:RNA polymerase sigma factor (TIGR02999 family)